MAISCAASFWAAAAKTKLKTSGSQVSCIFISIEHPPPSHLLSRPFLQGFSVWRQLDFPWGITGMRAQVRVTAPIPPQLLTN